MPRRSEKETPDLINYEVNNAEAGRVLAQRRQFLGLTMKELSDRAGVAPGTIVKLERGEFSVQLDKFIQVLDQLDLPIDVLIGYKGKKAEAPPDPLAEQFAKLLRSESFDEILRLLADRVTKKKSSDQND